eukprot:TRINITY_DN5024_c0_g1_i1.p1 TRINITY_DN5024_c0_g1~~TRINITY_DN5024_c0_g1_i1.p1  ORF type:complete len:424 (+),score=125.78 TRINITY_DN5024_c0_g1_i1:1769-3040(+)
MMSTENEVDQIFGEIAVTPAEQTAKTHPKKSKPKANENEGGALPIQIHLVAPEKVGEGIMNAHIEYKIQVKTTLPQYKSNEFAVVRRFKDFLWLREYLLENHKGYLVPPLPEKQIINRFNAEFIEFRRRELERFLNRIIAHPILVQSAGLQKFFESAESLSAPKAAPAKGEKKGGGFFSMLNSTVETISHITAPQNEPDQWFDAKKNYINNLEAQLTGLAKATGSVVKKHRELGLAYAEFATASSLLSSTEADHSPWISNSFNKLAEISTSVSNLQEALVDNETVFFEDSIRDYVRIIGAAKEMLQARTDKLISYQSATKNLESKKEKQDQGKGNPKLSQEIEAAERRVEDTKAEFNTVSDICKSEIGRFERTKAIEIKRMLVKLTQTNINYELQIIDQWKKYLADELSSDPESTENGVETPF